MVTSVTNRALFVQSGGFVGMGVPTVGVAVSGVAGVSVTEAVSVMGVPAVSVAMGGSVTEAGVVAAGASVAVDAGGCVAAPPLQADRASENHAVTMNSFLTILILLGNHVKPN
jgi:hypothetical protein